MSDFPEWHGQGAVFKFDNGMIYYEVEGQGPAVVLVGGGPGADHCHYHPWFSALADKHTVIYYDHPGTGRSRPVRDVSAYSVAHYSSAIEALRRHLGLGRIHLLGISFGGLPAVDYAVRYPQHLQTLVLSSAQVNADGWQEGNIDSVNLALRQQFPEIWETIQLMRQRGMRSIHADYQELLGRALPDLEWVDPWNHVGLAPSDVPFGWEAYQAFFGDDPEWIVGGSMAGYDPPLETIETPTLVLSGRYDRLTLPAISKLLAERVQDTEFRIFERSAHRPWAEEPAQYFQTLRTFFMTRG